LRPELGPEPRWGSLKRSPHTPNWIRGPLRGRNGREGRGGETEGTEGTMEGMGKEDGKGGEGKEREKGGEKGRGGEGKAFPHSFC